jgi:8-hydroxy-5-deazaflavin:NADPH oxidoreductase
VKVGIIGGTGALGRGLATRLASANEVMVGSRTTAKAEDAAKRIGLATGSEVGHGLNENVAETCDIAVLAIPDTSEASFIEGLRGPLKGKIVISPIVPMQKGNGLLLYSRKSGSAAEEVASILTESEIVAALHHVPALRVARKATRFDFDVLIACDRKEAYEVVSSVVGTVEGFRPLYVGPLAFARTLESLTPMLINVAILNKLGPTSLKLVTCSDG